MMARRTNAPCKGRIQKRKTTLHLFKSDLQRTAGPYKCVIAGSSQLNSITLSVRSGLFGDSGDPQSISVAIYKLLVTPHFEVA
jgi:hypothetical protein